MTGILRDSVIFDSLNHLILLLAETVASTALIPLNTTREMRNSCNFIPSDLVTDFFYYVRIFLIEKPGQALRSTGYVVFPTHPIAT